MTMPAQTMPTMSNKQLLTKPVVKQLIKKQPDVDKDQPVVELYCSEYRNQNCVPHSTNVKSYVFNGDDLFFEGYPYSVELSKDNCDRIKFEKCRFFEAHEGTLLRVFNINDKWYTSTNRRLDAFNSKWAAKTTTFGLHFAIAVKENIKAVDDEGIFEDEEEIFEDEEEETLEEKKNRSRTYLNEIYEANLDKSKKYMFLLEPCNEERIVCLTKSPRFFNIGVFDKDNNLSLDEPVILERFVVPTPREFMFSNMEEMTNALEKVNIDHVQGFIAIQSEKGMDDKHFKILNDRYKYLFEVRGNTPSIRFRYLELDYMNTVINLRRGTNQQTTAQTQQMLDDFCDLYAFNPYPLQNYIWCKVVEDLFQKYYNRYIRKITADPSVTVKQDKIIKEVHWYFTESAKNGQYRHTDRIKIKDILAMQKPSELNQLIAEYEKKDKDAERERRTRSMHEM